MKKHRITALRNAILLCVPNALFHAGLAYGQASSAGTVIEATPGVNELHERHPRYTLCNGDVIDLTFPFTPEFNQAVTVQPDGYITLNGIGDVHVAGKNIPDLKALLQKEYSKILHEPAITIVLKEFEKPYFIADGHVARPGKYDIRSDTTLTQAIAIAGGLIDSSKHSEVVLFRKLPDGRIEAKTLDVKKMLQSKDLSEDVYLQPGDTFFVPQNRMSKVRKYIPNSGVGVTVPTH
jgi:polysaccharide export outer membrane protein